MNKTNAKRIDRFITRYQREQQIGYDVAEERLMREFQRRVARKEVSRPPKASGPANGQQQPIQGSLEYALAESL